MVSSDKHLANVVGAKTARACDNCTRKRARWYCAADDAFLCQSCDGSVHAANPLARRHERLHLTTTSLDDKPAPPPWHQGFTKKPRTPRGGNQHTRSISRKMTKSEESSMSMSFNNPYHLVPEIGTTTVTCNQEQVLYQVPVFEPDVELAEFAADMESLLGEGVDEGSFANERVKVEEDEMQYEVMMEMMREPFDQLRFDYDSPRLYWEEKDDQKETVEGGGGGGDYRAPVKEDEDDENSDEKKSRIILKLVDFEGIIGAWDEQRSPWTTGDRPEVDPHDYCWPECMGGCGIMHHHHGMGMITPNPSTSDGGREARVSRYREKRRTRLFSKKIRYEVRKLNAEKRPRMKGRFVKRHLN